MYHKILVLAMQPQGKSFRSIFSLFRFVVGLLDMSGLRKRNILQLNEFLRTAMLTLK